MNNDTEVTAEVIEVETVQQVVKQDQVQVIDWNRAIASFSVAREVRNRIIEKELVSGEDYGEPFAGANKKVLLKGGAEKITDAFELYPDVVIVTEIEQWDEHDPLFYYKIKCYLKHRISDKIVATGLGSCNIRESKYWWRDAKPECPMCHENTIRLGQNRSTKKPQYYCWAKLGGCSWTFDEDSAEFKSLAEQKTGRIRNPDIFDQVNTVLKMAKKRAHVDAVLNFGFSDKFTQDIEDSNGHRQQKTTQQSPPAQKRPQKKAESPKKQSPKMTKNKTAELVGKIADWEIVAQEAGNIEKFKQICGVIIGDKDYSEIEDVAIAAEVLTACSQNRKELEAK